MAQTNIDGGKYWLYIDPLGGTDFSNLVCLLDHTFTMSNSTNTRQTYCGTKSTPGDQTQSVAFNGEIMINPDDGNLSAPDVFTLTQNQASFSWQIRAETPIAGDITKTGNGYFSAYNENYTAANVAGFGATISVDGDVVQTIEVGS